MRIKYIESKDKRVKDFNLLIKRNFPHFLDEKKPDLILVAGGDGAMLHAIYDTIDLGVPYFGKALGSLNFLMNKFEDDILVLQSLIDDKLEVFTIKSNAIATYVDNKKIGESANEVLVGDKIMAYHRFTISTEDGNFKDFEIFGSGICISTAIGSTAFNYNNGGRILPLDSNLLSLTGVVCNKFLNDIIPFEKIKIQSNGARIYLTNIKSVKLEEGSTLTLKKGKEIRFTFIDKTNFLGRRIELGHRYRK